MIWKPKAGDLVEADGSGGVRTLEVEHVTGRLAWTDDGLCWEDGLDGVGWQIRPVPADRIHQARSRMAARKAVRWTRWAQIPDETIETIRKLLNVAGGT